MKYNRDMKLTKGQVKHVAKLANLSLTSEEEEKYFVQLSETLDYVEQLNEIDTKNVEPTHSVTGLSNVMRSDETEPSLTQDAALQNAKGKENGFFKVKAIFDES